MNKFLAVMALCASFSIGIAAAADDGRIILTKPGFLHVAVKVDSRQGYRTDKLIRAFEDAGYYINEFAVPPNELVVVTIEGAEVAMQAPASHGTARKFSIFIYVDDDYVKVPKAISSRLAGSGC